METRKATRVISLVLISTMAVFFGFKSCIESDDGYASTQPSSGSHGTHWFWRGASPGRSGSSSIHSSGTSRGGFGSSGHSVGS